MNWAYLLRCNDNSLYAGWTVDLEKRLEQHNTGKGAKYTRSRKPVQIVWAKKFDTRNEAMGQEAQLKKMSKKQKEILVESDPYNITK